MNLIGYVRVSTEDQRRNGVSLDQQPERLRAYCALHGHTLIELLTDDGVSASVPLVKRAAGRQLMERLKRPDVDGVVVVRLDRLFRDALDGLGFFRGTAERHQVAVHSVSELIDSGTPAGKLALTIQLAAAQYERDLAVQRAIECNTSLREAGKVYGGVPYGCVAVGDGAARRLQRQPFTWQLRQGIVDALDQGTSLRGVRADLAARGIPSPTGRRVWSINTLRELRVHHHSLAGLPLAHVNHLASITGATPDPEISACAN